MNRNHVSFLIAFLLTASTAFAQIDPSLFAEMRWRMIGPFRGSRTVAAAGVPSQPSVFYIGAVNGGVWKTDNYGRTWTPIFDQQGSSIGAIAVALSDPKVIYVGSGEGLQRPDLSTGNGIYKSTDGGATWRQLTNGLPKSELLVRVGIEVAAASSNRLYAICGSTKTTDGMISAASGNLYRSDDAGESWQLVNSEPNLWQRPNDF